MQFQFIDLFFIHYPMGMMVASSGAYTFSLVGHWFEPMQRNRPHESGGSESKQWLLKVKGPREKQFNEEKNSTALSVEHSLGFSSPIRHSLHISIKGHYKKYIVCGHMVETNRAHL